MPDTFETHDQMLFLAEKLGELSDRFDKIQSAHDAQSAPLGAAKGAQEAALSALSAALEGIKALNFHVLDNNLGAVSKRLESETTQSRAETKELAENIAAVKLSLEEATKAVETKLSKYEQGRTELSKKHDDAAQQLAAKAERTELDAAITNLTEKIESARKQFATPAGLNPAGVWDSSKTYARLDVVTLNGTSWVSQVDGNNDKPAKGSSKWQVLASRGAAAGGGGSSIELFSTPLIKPFALAPTPAIVKVSADVPAMAAGVKVVVGGTALISFAAQTNATIDTGALAKGTDYAVYATSAGTAVFSVNFSAPTGFTTANSQLIGGFHYAIGGNAAAVAGGDATPAINEYSIWDLKFRPRCGDPRGMALVGGGYWMDIYLLNSTPDVSGTSRYNLPIADGSAPPKIPAMFGGNGSTAYADFAWYKAAETASAYGKRLPRKTEFMSAAYGVTEATSSQKTFTATTVNASATLTSVSSVADLVVGMKVAGTGITAGTTILSWTANTVVMSAVATGDNAGITVTMSEPTITELDAKRTSKWGLIQATGNMWAWGADLNFIPHTTALTGTPPADADLATWIDASKTGSYKAITGSRGSEHTYGVNGLGAALLGGNWNAGASAGSRASFWVYAPSDSSHIIGARFACDHLILL